jgi:hypothetical protein
MDFDCFDNLILHKQIDPLAADETPQKLVSFISEAEKLAGASF